MARLFSLHFSTSWSFSSKIGLSLSFSQFYSVLKRGSSMKSVSQSHMKCLRVRTSVVIYFSMTFNRAHQSLCLTSIHSQQSCCPLFGLLFAHKGLGLFTAFCLHPGFGIILVLPQLEVLLNLYSGNFHSWFGVLVTPDTSVPRNPKQLNCRLLGAAVEYTMAFQIWLWCHVL